MRKTYLTLVCLAISSFVFAQNMVTGTFTALNNQKIKLMGYDGFDTYSIDSVMCSNNGSFTMRYAAKDFGMAYLISEDNKSFVVILDADEDLKLQGEVLANPQSISIASGRQNKLFEQYAMEHPRREQTLSAWDYLEKIYASDPLFSIQNMPKQAILNEKQRIKAEDSVFLASIDPNLYVSWYLPLRKLVSSVSTIAQYRPAEIPAAIEAFRKINYTDKRLHKSGLLRDVIESHFWLLENSGGSIDSMYIEMNKSIDCMVTNLIADQQKLNEITEYLFKLLEKRSLFNASEYLALKLLNEQSCTINNDFASQLESYRAMKKGNTAPDFDFKEDVIKPGFGTIPVPEKISGLNNKYTVVVFGASWCSACSKELLNISQVYSKWKKYGVEVVFVSLDEDKQAFRNFAGGFPFISICDYKKWDSPVVKAYHVFASPTIYLLDHKRTILLRPNSVSHLDSWVDWYLVQGNP